LPIQDNDEPEADVDQIAGHPGKLVFRGAIIIKKCGDPEAQNYVKIFS